MVLIPVCHIEEIEVWFWPSSMGAVVRVACSYICSGAGSFLNLPSSTLILHSDLQSRYTYWPPLFRYAKTLIGQHDQTRRTGIHSPHCTYRRDGLVGVSSMEVGRRLNL